MELSVKFLLLVLLIAPSSFALEPEIVPPGSAGYHGITQAGSAFPPVGLRSATSHNIPEGSDPRLQDPANVQHMSIHDDGQYSFSYSAAHSARQERRNLDGSVQGSYSYVNPDGKLVQIDYTADQNGFNAYGEGVPPRQVAPSPYVVQDTPEVARARAEFLDYYQREFQARKLLEAQENATATPESVTVDGDGVTPAASAVSELNPSADVSDDDTVVITAGGENNGAVNVVRPVGARPIGFQNVATNHNNRPSDYNPTGAATGFVAKSEPAGLNGQGAYMLEYVVGNQAPGGYHNPLMFSHMQGLQKQQQQVMSQVLPQVVSQQGYQGQSKPQGQVQGQMQQGYQGNDETKTSPQYPAYFFYVGQGGLPYYVTSVPQDTNLPVSLRAAQVGAAPVAAVHDSQTPHYSGQQTQRLKQTPPLYVEVGNDYSELGKNPSSMVQHSQFSSGSGNALQPQLNPGQANNVYPPHFPFFGLPLYVYQ